MAISLSNTHSVVNIGAPSCLNWRVPLHTSLLVSCPRNVSVKDVTNKLVTYASAEVEQTTPVKVKTRKTSSIYRPKKKKGLQGARTTPAVSIALDPFSILKRQLITESAMKVMQDDNTLVFMVNPKADKFMIRDAIQRMYDVRVDKVNTSISPDGKKKAFIKLSKENNVNDIASRAGII
ncbi:60S ribosomal protein L23A [Rhynchospora pubera]|nr:60S ribosomal protein L23A [Rhynchospora pubera]